MVNCDSVRLTSPPLTTTACYSACHLPKPSICTASKQRPSTSIRRNYNPHTTFLLPYSALAVVAPRNNPSTVATKSPTILAKEARLPAYSYNGYSDLHCSRGSSPQPQRPASSMRPRPLSSVKNNGGGLSIHTVKPVVMQCLNFQTLQTHA